MKRVNSLGLLFSLYSMLFVIAPILSTKLIAIGDVKIMGGMFAMLIGYGILDIINNNYGVVKAKQAVIFAAITRAVVWVLIGLVLLLPSVAEPAGYTEMLGQSFRFLLAGELALILSQYFVDIWVFDKIRKMSKFGFWLRYNISNMFGQLLNMSLFVTLAFIGTGKPIFAIIMGGILLKLSASIILTPLFSLLTKAFKNENCTT